MKSRAKSGLGLVAVLIALLGSVAIGTWRERQRGIGATPVFAQRSPAPPPSVAVAEAEDEDDVEPLTPAPAKVEEPVEDATPAVDLGAALPLVQAGFASGERWSGAQLRALRLLAEAFRERPEAGELRASIEQIRAEFLARSKTRMPPELLRPAERFLEALGDQASAIDADRTFTELVGRTRAIVDALAAADTLATGAAATRRQLERAVAGYQSVLAQDPGHPRALKGLETVERILVDRALAAAADGNFVGAAGFLTSAGQVRGQSSVVDEARVQIEAARAEAEVRALADFEARLAANDYDGALAVVDVIKRIDAQSERLDTLRRRVENARTYGGFAPGETFSDPLKDLDQRGPRLRVLPLGRFVMGSPQAEPGRKDHEGPEREVRIELAIAMAQSEISVAEFAVFVQHSGYVTDAQREGYSAIYDERTGRIVRSRRAYWEMNAFGQRARRDEPVVHVSWNDANAYARWLAERTGQRYRLPTEAEFEYALRAGSLTRYWWGNDAPSEPVENLTGMNDRSRGGRSWTNAFAGYGDGFWGPAPVRSLKANPFGLFDMGGNVAEWVEDCWHDSYLRAPSDARAWVNPGCELRVVRGASWAHAPNDARSAARVGQVQGARGPRVGFRVVRELRG